MRRAMVATGALQSVALAVFAVAVVVNANQAHSTVGEPVAEAVIYLVFAGFLAGLTYALSRGAAWARTPAGVMQVFAVIVGYTLLMGSGTHARAAGAAVIASAAVVLTGIVRAR